MPVLFLALVTVVLPFLITILVPLVAGEPLAPTLSSRAARRGPAAYDAPQRRGRRSDVHLPAVHAPAGAHPRDRGDGVRGYSLIGEKQARTLEPLLATPITTTELLVAKGLGALPSLGIMLGALVEYVVAWPCWVRQVWCPP